ncbi:MAG: hypothetical protein AB7H97_20990 [Pseudobdellovibrionaceae bacterium]
MQVTIFLEDDEATVFGMGFKGQPQFNYGFEVDLPISEIVEYDKARAAWEQAQAKLIKIYGEKLQKRAEILERIQQRESEAPK